MSLHGSHTPVQATLGWDPGPTLLETVAQPWLSVNPCPGWLTQEGRGGYSAIAACHHDADARLYKGDGEVHDLGPLLIDGKRADGHVRTLIEHLGWIEELAREAAQGTEASAGQSLTLGDSDDVGDRLGGLADE